MELVNIIYVESLSGSSVEPLINISDDFSMEQSIDGDFQISFTSFKSSENAGYELLKNENYVHLNGYSFSIKSCSENYFSKSVVAVSSFFNNTKKQIYTEFSGSHTLANHLSFVLNGTGWNYDVDSDIANVTNYIDKLGNDNVIASLQKVLKNHEVEYVILEDNKLRFSKQIGNSEDFQLRYKYNVGDVVSNIDTSSLYTYVRGSGAEGITTDYTSPNASTFGILEDSFVSDERFTSVATLQGHLRKNLNDEPEITIESSVPVLTERSTGEKVWLIYPPLNLEMETRIISQTKSFVDGELKTTSVVIGNSKKKSTVDLAIEQQKEIDQTEEDLEEAKDKFSSEISVTNDRITLTVQELDASIAAIDIKADNINLSVNNRITNEMAAINLKADNINLSVNNRITNEVAAIDIRADRIESSVTSLSNSTSSSITQLSNNINLKIDKGGAITDINISPGNATINADKINLNGAVIVNGTISGATSIQVTTDVTLGRSLRFSDFTALTTGGGNLTLEAYNNINYVASRHYFNGTVDFSNANVVGL